MFLCIPLLFQFMWTKHPSWQKSCVYKCSVYHVHSYPILVFSYPYVFRIMQAKCALTKLHQLQVGVKGNFVWFVLSCRDVVHLTWAAPLTEASTKRESRLLTVFHRLTYPSLPPAPTAMASPSSTQQMNLRSTRVHSHSFVSPYVMHCLKLPATLSSYSLLRLQVRSKLMFKLEFKLVAGHISRQQWIVSQSIIWIT